MDIGSKIKALRKANKLTQVELSKKSNISRSYLADIERNRYNPSVDTLKALSKALDAPLTDFFDNEPINIQDNQEKFNYYIEKYLHHLGINLIYDSEGNIILDTKDAQYEITENDIKNLQESTDSFLKFKIFELMSKNRVIPKSNNIPMAAHNDFAKDPEEQRLMQEDLDEL